MKNTYSTRSARAGLQVSFREDLEGFSFLIKSIGNRWRPGGSIIGFM